MNAKVKPIRRARENRRAGRAQPNELGARYFDSRVQSYVRKVLPGAYAMNEDSSQKLVTILGSCVSACIRDPRSGYGGMNHFMLPLSKSNQEWGSDALAYRYGNNAMEVVLNEILRRGCRKSDLEIKLFGGGAVSRSSVKVGEKNIDFVRRFLKEEGLAIAAEDLGGTLPRRIYFDTFTGKVDRLLLQRQDDYVTVDRDEKTYQSKIVTEPEEDDIELFD